MSQVNRTRLGVLIGGGPGNTIGGTAPGDANTIGFNTEAGVEISGTSTKLNVEGNYIGTDAAHDNLGNQVGVLIINSSGNTIGGSTTGAANAIGWNAQQGVSIVSGIQNVVSRNLYVGTNGSQSSTNPPASDISLAQGPITINRRLCWPRRRWAAAP